MATTRDSLHTELERRLGDTSNGIWSDAELDDYLNNAITALYPYWFRRMVDETLAGAGPLQVAPANCRNIYMLGHKRTTSTRVRPLRNWFEGDGEAYVSKTGITGDTLVWAWTEGWGVPASGTEVLTFPPEANEAVLLRAQISAMEKLLVDRVSADKYHALQVRQASSDEDVASALDALHASLREHYDRAMVLPEIKA